MNLSCTHQCTLCLSFSYGYCWHKHTLIKRVNFVWFIKQIVCDKLVLSFNSTKMRNYALIKFYYYFNKYHVEQFMYKYSMKL
jgi:hypothetical protein